MAIFSESGSFPRVSARLLLPSLHLVLFQCTVPHIAESMNIAEQKPEVTVTALVGKSADLLLVTKLGTVRPFSIYMKNDIVCLASEVSLQKISLDPYF